MNQGKEKLAIVSTHPVQYNAPWFRLLAESGIFLKVFYTWSQASKPQFDLGFKKLVEWDIPLLEGYDYMFVNNTSVEPGVHHFKGIVNPDLNEVISDFCPDAILIFGWNFKSHLAAMRHFHGKIPVWFRGDSTLLDERPGLKKIMRRIFLRWVFSSVDKALYVGRENKKYFKCMGLTESQLVFAPHAIDNFRFCVIDPESDRKVMEWRNELGIGQENFTVIFAGKFEEKKNPIFVADLAKSMNEKNLRFIIAGSGELEKRLKELTLGDSRIIFLPFQNQRKMPWLYRLGDVFILPSKGPGETWGLAMNEAMASGLPVMASDKCGGASELIDEKTGYLFKSGDVNGCVQFIRFLMRFPEKRDELAENARTRIKGYNFEKIIEAISELMPVG